MYARRNLTHTHIHIHTYTHTYIQVSKKKSQNGRMQGEKWIDEEMDAWKKQAARYVCVYVCMYVCMEEASC